MTRKQKNLIPSLPKEAKNAHEQYTLLLSLNSSFTQSVKNERIKKCSVSVCPSEYSISKTHHQLFTLSVDTKYGGNRTFIDAGVHLQDYTMQQFNSS